MLVLEFALIMGHYDFRTIIQTIKTSVGLPNPGLFLLYFHLSVA